MPVSCSIYGLGIHVNVPMAGLAGLDAPRKVDVRLSLGYLPSSLDETRRDEWRDHYVSPYLEHNGEPGIRVSRLAANGYFRLAYADGTVIVVDPQGETVWAMGAAGATVEDTATYLLGPVLGFVLRLRGIVCLHASAVVIDGRAVALVGASGCGKSSTAAAFARAGHLVLTDDVAALADEGSRFKVQPAYPRVRLWPESVTSMFGFADALPRITPTWDKRFLDLQTIGFQREPVPLAAIYFLEERSTDPEMPCIEALSARASLMALVSHSYATYSLDKTLRAKEFEMLNRLVKAVPIRRVTPSADFGRISELCDAITRDVRRQVLAEVS